jgi:hypothetical protein
MSDHDAPRFLSGVVEGFYGEPWTESQRLELFERMAAWGLDTYFYAPKDDLKHRALWRELYTDAETGPLRASIDACRVRRLRFVYGLSPGLDLRYADDADVQRINARFEQMLALGCEHFALLFDDIPDGGGQGAGEAPAVGQCRVTNALFAWTRERRPDARFAFCPTAYCSRMAEAGVGGRGYLETVGRTLLPGIDILWTGPEIVSRDITVEHLRGVRDVLGRPPILWDNLHANDYDGRRFFCGPYAGRPAAVTGESAGILLNPNTEAVLNYVPIRTLASFVADPASYEPRRAYLAAIAEWLPWFSTVHGPLALDDLTLLGDCYYLPHEEGPQARELIERVGALLENAQQRPAGNIAAVRRDLSRLRDLAGRLNGLHDRPLFHALGRRLWDLREEVDLLEKYLALQAESDGDVALRSDFHQPGTCRGGMVAALQRLLVQQPDGAFVAAAAVEDLSRRSRC